MSGRQRTSPATQDAPSLTDAPAEGQAGEFGSNADQQGAVGLAPRDQVAMMLEEGIPDWNAFCGAVDALPDADWQSLMKNPIWEAVYDEAAQRNGEGDEEDAEPAEAAEADGGDVAAEAEADVAPAAEIEPSANVSTEQAFASDRALSTAMMVQQARAASRIEHEIGLYVGKYIHDAGELDGETPDGQSLAQTSTSAGGTAPGWQFNDRYGLEGDQLVSFTADRSGFIDPRALTAGYLWNEFRGTADASIATTATSDGRTDLTWTQEQDFSLNWTASASALSRSEPDVTVEMKPG